MLRFDGDNGKYSLLMGHAHSEESPKQVEHKLRPDTVEPSEEELKRWLRE